MIISDRHRFAFVHIPKCAGTSVRRLLSRFDDTQGRYEPSVKNHPVFGRIDCTHLPMKIVQKAFPEDFEKIRRYEAFAVIRHPRDRFISALSQRLKVYVGREIAQLDNQEISRLSLETIRQLKRPGVIYQPEFIHFAPQIDFVRCDGEKVVNNIYPVSRIEAMVRFLSEITGEELGCIGNENPTLVFRFGLLRSLALRGKWLGERLLAPSRMMGPTRSLARQILMTRFRDSAANFEFSDEVSQFVRTFYSRDFELYAQALRSPEKRLSREVT